MAFIITRAVPNEHADVTRRSASQGAGQRTGDIENQEDMDPESRASNEGLQRFYNY